MIQRLTEEEINIFPHYIELFCHRLAKDMLVNFLLFISTPMLTKLCLRWILLNLISMMDCESFKKKTDWWVFCVFLLLLYNSCQISCSVLNNWKARNMLATTLMGRIWVTGSTFYWAWEYEPIPLPFLTQLVYFQFRNDEDDNE